jgi:hypothetical protein
MMALLERERAMTIDRVAAIAALLACLGLAPAAAQQPKPRPFDRVTGIVFACGSATGFAWTGEACDRLSAEFKKRAALSKLPFVEVPITADFRSKKRDVVDGFDQDKAVRVFWNFVESKSSKGQISASLSSNFIYEPTAKDHPNIAPGQRIPMNFYAQSALFDPGVTYAKAESYLTMLTDNFFQVGEGKI